MTKIKFNPVKLISAIGSASLPELLFMLLFFFMVTTALHEVEPLVQITLPTATNMAQLEGRSRADHHHVKPSVIKEFAMAPLMQMDEDLAPWEGAGLSVEEDLYKRMDQ